MKKIGIGLWILIFMSGTILAQPATENSSETAREILINYTSLVQEFVLNTTSRSSEIIHSDMTMLQELTDRFFELKKSITPKHDLVAFEREDTFNLLFMHEADQAIDVYFEKHVLWFKDDKFQTVKRFFAKYGCRGIEDLEINPTKIWQERIALGLVVTIVLTLVFGYLGFLISDEVGGWTAVVVFIATLACFLFVF